MFHMALSSLEPLPLDTFMSALDFVMDNKAIFSSAEVPINTHDAEALDSVINHLRRLNSRSGGLLETQIITFDRSTLSPKRNQTGEQTGDGNKDLSHFHHEMIDGVLNTESYNVDFNPAVSKSPQSIQYVEFLHATAKDYIRNNHNTILVERTEYPFAGLRGHAFLFLSCISCKSWVVPIKKHVLYYAKMAEEHFFAGKEESYVVDGRAETQSTLKVVDGRAGTQSMLKLGGYLRTILLIFVSNSGRYDFDWWLQLRSENFFRILERTRFDMTKEYIIHILAVAANLKHLIQRLASGEISESLERTYSVVKTMSLIYVAAVGHDLVPTEHQDRVGMIKILLSLGCDVDGKTLIPRPYLPHQLPTGEFGSYVTPLWAVLIQPVGREDSDDSRLRVAECLLEQGASTISKLNVPPGEETMLNYCIQWSSVALVQLLLRYGAETNPYIFHLKPAQHAAIRQDKAIMEAVREFGGSLKPHWVPAPYPNPYYGGIRPAIIGMGFVGSLGHPAVSFACAQASSWSQEATERMNEEARMIRKGIVPRPVER